MRKFVKVILIAVILISSIYLYRVNKNEYIKSHTWKYKSGEYFGDFLIFEKKNDTLKIINNYKENSKKTIFSFGFILTVKDSKTGKKGIYYNKGIW